MVINLPQNDPRASEETGGAKVKFELFQKSALDPSALKKESVDLTITSPPYNLGIHYHSNNDALSYQDYLTFSETWLRNCYLWSKETGRLCLNVLLDKNKYGQHSIGADLTALAKSVGWRYQSTIIWHKQNIFRRTAWGSWRSASAPYVIAPVELIIVFYKGAWKKSHRGISDVARDEFIPWTNGLWSFPGENSRKVGHPAPFPGELPRRCIKLFSFVGDTVLDPFAGSGTTLLEAVSHHRYAYGLEIDPSYLTLAYERIQRKINSRLPQTVSDTACTAGSILSSPKKL